MFQTSKKKLLFLGIALAINFCLVAPTLARAGDIGLNGQCVSDDTECQTGLTCQSNPTDNGATNICIATTASSKNAVEQANARIINPLDSLQVKIPGLENFSSTDKAGTCTTTDGQVNCTMPWIAIYIKALTNYSFSILGLLAAIMLMIGGVIYLASAGNTDRISTAKKYIGGSLTGLLLGFTTFILLNEVNPDLLKLKAITLFSIKHIDVLSDKDYQTFTGSKPIKAMGPEMITYIKNAAQAKGLDACILYSIVSKESGGRVGVVGHDEDVPGAGSYTAYVKELVTYLKVPFTGFKANDDLPDVKKPDLGLDWRFSHGIGLTQITIFPNHTPWSSYYITKSGIPAAKVNGNLYSPKELFDPQTSLLAAADLIKQKRCNLTSDTGLLACFKSYNGTGAAADKYAADVMSIYKTCKEKNGP